MSALPIIAKQNSPSLMPHYMVLLLNRMVKWLPKPDYSGTMSGRKITCRRLDYWSRSSAFTTFHELPEDEKFG
uniref:Uncharacterized protein n=1 Tax=Onchocerca volvulus TaxID=6282 RepID=A0A8R1XPT3_ONCVO